MKVNWLFKNVTVIDGSGGPQFLGDVAVKGDRIVDMAPALNLAAEQVVEGLGRVLAPGFIDVHTHDDINVIRMPEYLPKLSQGVTTVIVGNCGISAATATMRDGVPDPMNLLGEQEQFIYPTVEAYAHAVEAAKPSLNVGTLIGHTALRNNHMDDLFRPATESEIAGMRVQLRDALRQGALGLSTGLAYASAFQSTTEEVMALAEELAAEKGIYTTHLRSEFEPILEALDEEFRIGRHGNVPVVVSHHKYAGAKNWGRTKETLAFFDEMRQRQEIACDCYPYSASSSTLDMKQVTDEFDIVITRSEAQPEQAGKTLKQIADGWQVSLHDAAARLMPAGAIYYNMDEQDVRRVLAMAILIAGMSANMSSGSSDAIAALAGGAGASVVVLMDSDWMAFWGNPCIPSVLTSLVASVVVTLLTPASKMSREEALEMITQERESRPSAPPLPIGKRNTSRG